MGTAAIFILIAASFALLMYYIGYSLASRKRKKSLVAIINEYDSDIKCLREENSNLAGHLEYAISSKNQVYNAFLTLNNEYIQCREYIDTLLNHDATIKQNYSLLHDQIKLIDQERAGLMKKMESYEKVVLPVSQDYHRTKYELTATQSNLVEQQQENMLLRKTHTTLSEEKKQILEKLQKVCVAYKVVSSKAEKLQNKARVADTVTLERDTLSTKYHQAVQKLNQQQKQIEKLRALELEKSELLLQNDLLKARLEETESIIPENRQLREQIESQRKKIAALETENGTYQAKDFVIEKTGN